MFSSIKSIIKSIELYLKLKNKKFYYDLHKDFSDKEDAITQRIEKLRDSGDSSDADRADLLRERLRAERERFKHLSAFYTQADKG
tara:strand:- start:1521 stop:1775 length:255 start_codon:yes stop_codon:yes gene_type:complete